MTTKQQGTQGTDTGDSPRSETVATPQVRFDYIKSNYFRTIHVDGAWGGVRGDLTVQMALFTERSPIPRQLAVRISPNGEEDEVEATRRDTDIVREVETNVIMDYGTAVALRDWLGQKIETIEKRARQLQASSSQASPKQASSTKKAKSTKD